MSYSLYPVFLFVRGNDRDGACMESQQAKKRSRALKKRRRNLSSVATSGKVAEYDKLETFLTGAKAVGSYRAARENANKHIYVRVSDTPYGQRLHHTSPAHLSNGGCRDNRRRGILPEANRREGEDGAQAQGDGPEERGQGKPQENVAVVFVIVVVVEVVVVVVAVNDLLERIVPGNPDDKICEGLLRPV